MSNELEDMIDKKLKDCLLHDNNISNDKDKDIETYSQDNDVEEYIDDDVNSIDNISIILPQSESMEILARRYIQRDQIKTVIEKQDYEKRLLKYHKRKEQIAKWERKTSTSPFLINLVAENERLDEEHRKRHLLALKQTKVTIQRAKKAKNEVILKALTETSELDILRHEKRAILDEERRLKALMDLEKTNSHRKLDLLVARHAEKKRQQDKLESRRQHKLMEINTREYKYRELLKEKLAIE